MKIPMTPAGIEPATFRFLARHLNHCATAVPLKLRLQFKIIKWPITVIIIKILLSEIHVLQICVCVYLKNKYGVMD